MRRDSELKDVLDAFPQPPRKTPLRSVTLSDSKPVERKGKVRRTSAKKSSSSSRGSEVAEGPPIAAKVLINDRTP